MTQAEEFLSPVPGVTGGLQSAAVDGGAEGNADGQVEDLQKALHQAALQLNHLMKETLDTYAQSLSVREALPVPLAFMVMGDGKVRPLRLQHQDILHEAQLSLLFRTLGQLREKGLIQAAVVYDRIDKIPGVAGEGPFVLAQLEHGVGLGLVRWMPYTVSDKGVGFGEGGQKVIQPVIFAGKIP